MTAKIDFYCFVLPIRNGLDIEKKKQNLTLDDHDLVDLAAGVIVF